MIEGHLHPLFAFCYHQGPPVQVTVRYRYRLGSGGRRVAHQPVEHGDTFTLSEREARSRLPRTVWQAVREHPEEWIEVEFPAKWLAKGVRIDD